MIKAHLRFATGDSSIAVSLIRAAKPDNTLPGLVIRGRATPTGASFRITFEGRIETFISTLDDLVQCLQAAMGTLRGLADRNKE